MTSGALPTTVETFVERLGLVCEDDMPRTAGRIMALMLIREGPLGFDELADMLQVSRGSISNDRLGCMDRYYSLVIRKVEEGLEEWREEEE